MHDTAELKARRTIASALKCSLDAVGPGASVDSTPQWDSIGHVTIILEIEGSLGRTLSPEEIAAIGSVADIARLFEHQAASA